MTKVLNAIELAISKWERNAEITTMMDADISPKTCALCQEFLAASTDGRCDGCPVFKFTGQRGCAGTPYDAAHAVVAQYRGAEVLSSDDLDRFVTEFRLAAESEVLFLRFVMEGMTDVST